MTKLLLRVLSVVRWPSAVLATVTLGLTLVSSHRALECSFNLWDVSKGGVDAIEGSFYAVVVDAPKGGWGEETRVWFSISAPAEDGPCFAGWWRWMYFESLGFDFPYTGVVFPLWCIFVPLGALSALGFRAKRRLVITAGACANCRHPLAGAALCPECGAAAASSGVSAHQP